MSQRRKVILLGSTGSIGTSALKVIHDLSDELEVIALAANGSVEALAKQIHETGVKHAALYDENKISELRALIPSDVKLYAGAAGLLEIATLAEAHVVLVAIVGTAGLQPTLAAIRAGKDIAIASKEILVMAGEIVTREAAAHGVALLPVDSEHNAIFQCLHGHKGGEKEISRLILTASGGPFRKTPAADLASVTPAQALKHPTWEMGKKITIDSSTLFNKGLEMIEAKWLFGIGMEKVDVIVHPQSIIHSMVEFLDGSVLAQLSHTDMCFPIQYALTFPARRKSSLRPINFAELRLLEFEAPRYDDFPALNLAKHCGLEGGTLPAVYNAANEIAVDAFLSNKISFPTIWRIVEKTLDVHEKLAASDLATVIAADTWAREYALGLL